MIDKNVLNLQLEKAEAMSIRGWNKKPQVHLPSWRDQLNNNTETNSLCGLSEIWLRGTYTLRRCKTSCFRIGRKILDIPTAQCSGVGRKLQVSGFSTRRLKKTLGRTVNIPTFLRGCMRHWLLCHLSVSAER